MTMPESTNSPAEVLGRVQVFLDCDGVLADFDAYALDYFGVPPRLAERELGSAEFWRRLEAKGDFYRNLPVMDDAFELFDGVRHLNPIILTGCPRGDWAQAQKIAWAAEHFGPEVPIITCRSVDKRDHANPGEDRPALARQLMGMPWATMAELSEAVPPAFTRYIGRQLMAHLQPQRNAA